MELVLTNQQGHDVTTSCIVAEVFSKRHSDVLRDVRNLHCSDDFRKRNFALMVEMKQLPQGGASKSEYYEITKDGFSFLVMGYTGEEAGRFKERFISEFNKRESLLRNDDYIISRAMTLLNDRVKMLEQQINQSQEQIKLQQQVIEQAAPKVEYYETVLNSSGLMATTQVAADLGISAIKLNRFLFQVLGWQFKVNGVWVPSVKIKSRNYMQSRTHAYINSRGETEVTQHFYWTQAGRAALMQEVKRYRDKNLQKSLI
jgi:Rha family phage regulatory protein